MLATVIRGRARIKLWCLLMAPTPGQSMIKSLKEVRVCGSSEEQNLPLGVEQGFGTVALVTF